jgi:purine catabolism regulator
MLTIRQALALPVFETAQLVAGAAGLDNPIHWVHIVDIPDANYEWQRQGVLLLTAGFGLRQSPQRQAALVPKLVEQGFAGMVFCTGYYFDQVPQVICRDADELGFPIVQTPPELLFIHITEAILERIISRQYALLQQSNRIYAQLTELVLQGATLSDLAATLARLLARSITIEDPAFHILASAEQGTVDIARRRSLDSGRTTPEVAQRLLDAGIYTKLLEQMGSIRVPPMPDLGMEMERFVAPIIVDREIYGYIWIISGEHPLTDLDELALSHGATVAALILFKEQAVHKAEEALRGDFLERLLRGDGESSSFSELAQRLGYRVDRPHQVLLIHGPTQTGGTGHTLLHHVAEWLETQAIQPLLIWRGDHLVLILEGNAVAHGQATAQAMIQALSHPVQPLLIGVGEPCPAAAEEAGGIQRSYEQAREAIRIGRALARRDGVVSFAELGLLHWLYHLPPERWAGNLYLDHIKTLAAYDARRNTKLIQTLDAYLEHGGSLVEAAQALFIHRNTLLHRLERIEKLCPVDLRHAGQRLNLHAALKGYQLFHREE